MLAALVAPQKKAEARPTLLRAEISGTWAIAAALARSHQDGSGLQLDRGHVAVITLLRVASPQQLVTLEGTHALVDFLELG